MEGLMEQTGNWGRFQWLLVGALKWGVMPVGWSMMQMAFAGTVPDWWCLPSPSPPLSPPDHYGNASSNEHIGNWSRDNGTYQACEIPGSAGNSCAGHVVFDNSLRTVINEWALICDRSYIKGLMTSLQMGGVLFGALIGGQATDTFGRRLTVYVTMLVHTVTSLVAAFSVTWQMFVVMRVLIGITLGIYLVASFSYSLEFVGPQHRQLVAFIPAWATGVCLMALMAWLIPDWRYLHIGSAVLTVPFLLTWCVIPESARWLATKGRLQEAERVVQYVARVNRRPLPHNILLTLQHVALEEEKVGQGRRYTYLDVYRGYRMAITTLILNGIWFATAFSYYGIAFGVSGLSGNLYLNIFLLSIVEVPCNVVSLFLSNRNLGYGASSTVSRIGGALAPLLLNMDTEMEVVRAYIIMGSLMMAGGLGSMLLRETNGQILQDSIIVESKVEDNDKAKDTADNVKNTRDTVKGDGQGESQNHSAPQTEISVWTVNSS
ncbi:hypothetical protein ACOMHN_016269 [Nucella lapillus]